jgi:peptide/nickel transport system substrate-binding protein
MTRPGPTHDPDADAATVSRRQVLGALGAGAVAATSGCLRRARALMNRDSPSQLSLRIATTPADEDPRAIRIARYLAQRLETVGIDPTIQLSSREELYRTVLLDQTFDVYVAPFHAPPDPDFLRPLLHSRFGAEPGWQNPFGYANLDVDAMLERQRRQTGPERRETLADVQRAVVRDQPFSVVAVPETLRVTRSPRYTGWAGGPIHTPLGYLRLERDDDPVESAPGVAESGTVADTPGTGDDPETLRATLTDSRPSENHNPLAAEFHSNGPVTGLLYDSLGRWVDGAVRPWLAESWTWDRHGPDDGLDATVRLRDDLTWHDGTDLTAADVAFTFRFLADTSLGRLESAVPAPCFRGLETLVTDTSVVDDRTLELSFGATSTAVAARSLTAPVLPEHVWASKAAQATVAGLDVNGPVTEALVWANPDPVGSGPLRFERSEPKASVVLSSADEHFLTREGLPSHLEPYAGGFAPDRLVFRVVPSGGAAVELVEGGTVAATGSAVLPSDLPEDPSADLARHVRRPRSFYHVGYNVRTEPLSSPRFRRALARLLDKPFLVESVFDGHAAPAASPLARHAALAPDLTWDGQDPALPFTGTDGELDVDRAREQFRSLGYRYSNDGALLGT